LRLCLIYPPDAHMIRTNVPSVVDEVTGCYPPLGLLYVAGAAERSGQHEISIIDCIAEGLTEAELEKRIAALQPDVVGIEAITFSIVDAFRTAGLVKRVDESIKVLLGGPHVNLYPEQTLQLPAVDYVLLGESETNIEPFLTALRDGEKMDKVPGVVYRGEDGTVRFGPPNPLIEDLDSLPMPARHLLNNELYSSVLGTGKRLTTIMSSRGCPARCIFCDRPHLGKSFRARSAGNVVDELELCVERFGIGEFFFYDDTFTIDHRRVFDVCCEIRLRGLDIYWDIRARVSTVDLEVLEELAKAGCKRIHFGIESGNPKVLKAMRKGLDLDRARQVFKWCRAAGIETLAYFMLGFPEEGRAEIQDTIDYALSLECDYVHVAVTTPFPGTELYRLGLERGLYASDYWAEFAANPSPDFVPELWTENFSREELIETMFLLYHKFYRRPAYLLRRVLKVRSLKEFWMKAKAGVRIIFQSGKS